MNAQPALVRPCFVSEFDYPVTIWMIRMALSNASALRQINDGIYSEDVRQLIGISPLDEPLKRSALRKVLKLRLEELTRDDRVEDTDLFKNIRMLSKLLALNTIEESIFTVVALSYHHIVFGSFFDGVRIATVDSFIQLLSELLNADIGKVRDALSADSNLLRTRILTIQKSEIGRDVCALLPQALVDSLIRPAKGIQGLMGAFLQCAEPPLLTEAAFPHLSRETELLSSYLIGARRARVRGVNLLITGIPGTGKTQYVRWLASHLKRPLYEVRALNDRGEVVAGSDRLAFFQLSQQFLQNSDALILFDEIEDVFPTEPSAFFVPDQQPRFGKMFINQLLESNPVPAIWVSNEVDQIDKAYLRRFDFSFEMGVPPIAVRRRILSQYLRRFRIANGLMDELSQQEALTPAQIEKAAKILKYAGFPKGQRESTLRHVVDNSMLLLEQRKTEVVVEPGEEYYQITYLNADCDLDVLRQQLKSVDDVRGAFCFYGPPGTGKTAFAQYLARDGKRRLLTRRASDILSPYVGESEQRIAGMFAQAKEEGAMLLLDEADSFLAERRSARQSWEVTAVNEMLVQMERFEGLFICSTNLMERLDAASLRRFALKIKFDYLKPEQRWQLFLSHLPKRSLRQEREIRMALDRLSQLTPGDFATVRRRAQLFNETLTAELLLNRLKEECKSKSATLNRPIGFVRS